MRKTYLLNQNLNSCTFTIQDEGGNSARYAFTGGNVITNTRPYLQLENPYFQNLLEKSEMFQTGRVVFDPQTAKMIAEMQAEETKAKETSETVETVEGAEGAGLTAVMDIKTVSEAVNYCAEHFGVAVKTAAQAKALANENGIDFPNLKTGKK